MLILFLQIGAILLTSRLFGYLGKRVGQAQAVSDMVAGIALGPSLFGVLAPGLQGWLFPHHVAVVAADVAKTTAHPSMTVLYSLSQLGIALYMFIVGLDFDTAMFRSRARSVAIVSFAGIVVPLLLGAGAALLLLEHPGFFNATISPSNAALFLAASMSVTAFPVLARILDEKGLLSTRLGTMLLTAGSMDDVVAWCLLAVVLASLNAAPSLVVLAIAGGAAYALVMVMVGRRAFAVFAGWTDRDDGVTPSTLSIVLVVLMLSAAFTDFIGIHSVFGAFLAGAVMPRGRFASEVRKYLESLTTTLLLPLFFVYSGLNTRIGLLNTPMLWWWTAVIILLAVAGKGLACAVAARIAGESWRDAAAIGTLMNARGLVELIMLNAGLEAGVIQPTLFTIMVLMAVTTTVMASPFFELFHVPHLRPAPLHAATGRR